MATPIIKGFPRTSSGAMPSLFFPGYFHSQPDDMQNANEKQLYSLPLTSGVCCDRQTTPPKRFFRFIMVDKNV
jgi:hypothetical protein